MNIEKAKVPLAELRVILEKNQPEMASLLGVSLPTIQSIESGRMRLSKKLAGRVFFETGANLNWLSRRLKSKSHPPIDSNGKPYTKATFLNHRAIRETLPTGDQIQEDIIKHTGMLVARIASVLIGVGPKQYLICRCKLHDAVSEIGKEFGSDRATMNQILERCGPCNDILSPKTIDIINHAKLPK